MTSPSEPRTPRLYHAGAGSALPPLVAVGALSAGMASMLAIGVVGQAAGLPVLPLLLAGQLVFLAIPILLMRGQGLRPAALGLRWPRRDRLFAALLIGATGWYLNVRLVELLPFEEGHLRGLERLVDEPPLVVAILAIALVPAVCEEVMFRGAVQRSLATRLFPIAAIVLTAMLFAGYHLSLIQLLPTFTLGLALGALAHHGDSVVPSIAAHFLNNTFAILVSRKQPAALASWIEVHPTIALIGCAVATGCGLTLLARGPA